MNISPSSSNDSRTPVYREQLPDSHQNRTMLEGNNFPNSYTQNKFEQSSRRSITPEVNSINNSNVVKRNLTNSGLFSSNGRRYSDSMPLNQSKYLQHHHDQTKHQSMPGDHYAANGSRKTIEWQKFPSSPTANNFYNANIDNTRLTSSDSQKVIGNNHADVNSLFGTYSSLTNFGSKCKENLYREKSPNVAKNFIPHRMSTSFQTNLQCVPSSYATISSSAFRELTQKVK